MGKMKATLPEDFGTDPNKLHRREGPDTSVAAAHSIDTTIGEKRVYNAIAAYGPAGCISDDIRAQFPDLPYSTITARYKALKDKGLIYDTGERRPGKSGRKQAVLAVKL